MKYPKKLFSLLSVVAFLIMALVPTIVMAADLDVTVTLTA